MQNNSGMVGIVYNRKNINLPNALTLARIAAVPFVCYFIHQSRFASAAVLFVIAALTDLLDGFLARRCGTKTRFGKLIDPFADKLLVGVTIAFLDEIWVVSKVVIWAREIIMITGRLLVVSSETESAVKVDNYGKWKSVVQYIGIPYSMLGLPGFNIVMAVAALLTFLTGANYSFKLYIACVKSKRG